MIRNADVERTSRATSSTDHMHRTLDNGRSKIRMTLLRPAVDGIIAFIVFLVATAGLMSAPLSALPNPAGVTTVSPQVSPSTLKAIAEPGPAAIIEIATTSSADAKNAVFRRTSNEAAWGLLAFAFAVLAALNLAVLRHLRRTYALPKRRF